MGTPVFTMGRHFCSKEYLKVVHHIDYTCTRHIYASNDESFKRLLTYTRRNSITTTRKSHLAVEDDTQTPSHRHTCRLKHSKSFRHSQGNSLVVTVSKPRQKISKCLREPRVFLVLRKISPGSHDSCSSVRVMTVIKHLYYHKGDYISKIGHVRVSPISRFNKL